MSITQTLAQHGLTLPPVSKPGGTYESVNIRNSRATIAIQFPIDGERFLYQGKLGLDLTTAEGVAATRLAALNVLAQIDSKIGFKQIAGLEHLDAYYYSTPGWDDGPLLADAASGLFVEILGDRGRHTRAIFGVAHLPRNFCVGLTVSVALKP